MCLPVLCCAVLCCVPSAPLCLAVCPPLSRLCRLSPFLVCFAVSAVVSVSTVVCVRIERNARRLLRVDAARIARAAAAPPVRVRSAAIARWSPPRYQLERDGRVWTGRGPCNARRTRDTCVACRRSRCSLVAPHGEVVHKTRRTDPLRAAPARPVRRAVCTSSPAVLSPSPFPSLLFPSLPFPSLPCDAFPRVPSSKIGGSIGSDRRASGR